MAEYTIELWEVVEMEGGVNMIGLHDYPIFDETYRNHLNNKIFEHFYNREIGVETISMFRLQLRRKMNEIMPYWNKHYEASQIQFDPLKTISVATVTGSEGSTNTTGEGETNSTSDGKSRAVASNFPQMLLSDNGDYADTGQDNISNTVASANSSETQATTNTGNVESETNGYQGNAAILIAEYRATLVNTDMDVINQLETMFMGIWGSTDDYIEGGHYRYGYFGYNGFSH